MNEFGYDIVVDLKKNDLGLFLVERVRMKWMMVLINAIGQPTNSTKQ